MCFTNLSLSHNTKNKTNNTHTTNLCYLMLCCVYVKTKIKKMTTNKSDASTKTKITVDFFWSIKKRKAKKSQK
jgi:hypothetical protein